jgi:hypothetical protein
MEELNPFLSVWIGLTELALRYFTLTVLLNLLKIALSKKR